MNLVALAVAIRDYFRGERLEMFAILGASLGLMVVAAALYAAGRDGFARAFGLTSLLIVIALSSTAVSLLRRDPPHQAMLLEALQSADAKTVLSTEATRMAKVIEKYPYYRYAALALGLLALVGVTITRKGWVVGLAAGLLLLVVAQLTIDHYSEQRARRYADQLNALRWTS